ncbi:hypothetical protein GCM10023319_73610 [Nocardia iowensis]
MELAFEIRCKRQPSVDPLRSRAGFVLCGRSTPQRIAIAGNGSSRDYANEMAFSHTNIARMAIAANELQTTAEVLSLMRTDDMPKGDVLSTARIAGIAAAKKTPELSFPLCHQQALSSVRVKFGFIEATISVEAAAKSKGPHRRRDGGADSGRHRWSDHAGHGEAGQPRAPP